MHKTLDIIQGLWIGDHLSTMEQLSIASFLDHGHEYHLYVYQPVSNVPAGTSVKDAYEILPESMIFQYRKHPSYAGFANFFRYKLLLDVGGWWVDTDTVCLRPFDFASDYVFSSEPTKAGTDTPSTGFIKVPPGSAIMGDAWAHCRVKDTATLTWGETGARLLGELIGRHNLGRFVEPSATFAPVPFYEWRRLLDADGPFTFAAATRAVHLWNEMWRRDGRHKDARYDPACPYERWKALYLHGTSSRLTSGIPS
jgi:Glycosyltransferase sugar-binding region containing DXD motif